MFGSEAIEILKRFEFQTVLDIGCGGGVHSRIFQELGKTVTTVDIDTKYKPTIVGDFCEIEIQEQFDLVWCCHVLEHQKNVNIFLKKIFKVLKSNGILAITVPPAKHNIVGGHLTIWNAGLLLYNLILAGFDCKETMIKQYDYNISIILKKSSINVPNLNMDLGDIELLKTFFPFEARQGFNGNIRCINWNEK